MIPINFPYLTPFNFYMAIPFYLLYFTPLDYKMPILADPFPPVILDPEIHVFLRMDEELLFALVIFKADFIEALSSGGAVRLDRALCLFVGKGVRRHQIRIVNPACDERLIRVAFEKVYNDLLADPRCKDGAILSAGKDARYTYPAGRFIILLPFPVPVKLHLDPAVFVGVNLLAFGSNHHCGLDPFDNRPGCFPLRSEIHRRWNSQKII